MFSWTQRNSTSCRAQLEHALVKRPQHRAFCEAKAAVCQWSLSKPLQVTGASRMDQAFVFGLFWGQKASVMRIGCVVGILKNGLSAGRCVFPTGFSVLPPN